MNIHISSSFFSFCVCYPVKPIISLVLKEYLPANQFIKHAFFLFRVEETSCMHIVFASLESIDILHTLFCVFFLSRTKANGMIQEVSTLNFYASKGNECDITKRNLCLNVYWSNIVQKIFKMCYKWLNS